MASNTITKANPKKLRNGSWGAWAKSEDVRKGDVVRITTKSGKSWKAEIVKVLWSGKGGAICATRSLDRAPRATYGGYEPECHTDGNCSSVCSPKGNCPCATGHWFTCC